MINKIKIKTQFQPAEISYKGNTITAYIFNNLENVAAGESIYCDTEEGKPARFEVIEKKFYNFDAHPDEIFGNGEDSLLKLITCAGNWQLDYDTLAERLVVTARRMGE